MEKKYKVEISMELKDLIPTFLEETKKNINNLDKSIQKNDLEQIRFYSHRIKGSAGTYGFSRVSLIAKNIEDIVKTNYNQELVQKLFNDLENVFNHLEIEYVNRPL